MQSVSVREARQKIGRLLDAVAVGEKVIITRRGRPVAKLMQIEESETLCFPKRNELRSKIPPAKKTSAQLIREMRDERG